MNSGVLDSVKYDNGFLEKTYDNSLKMWYSESITLDRHFQRHRPFLSNGWESLVAGLPPTGKGIKA